MPQLNANQFTQDEFSGNKTSAILARSAAPKLEGRYAKEPLPFMDRMDLQQHVVNMGNHFLNMSRSNPDVPGDVAGNEHRQNFRKMTDYHARYLLGDNYGKETPGVSDNSIRERTLGHGMSAEALNHIHQAAANVQGFANDFIKKTGAAPSGAHLVDEIQATNHRFAKKVTGMK